MIRPREAKKKVQGASEGILGSSQRRSLWGRPLCWALRGERESGRWRGRGASQGEGITHVKAREELGGRRKEVAWWERSNQRKPQEELTPYWEVKSPECGKWMGEGGKGKRSQRGLPPPPPDFWWTEVAKGGANWAFLVLSGKEGQCWGKSVCYKAVVSKSDKKSTRKAC